MTVQEGGGVALEAWWQGRWESIWGRAEEKECKHDSGSDPDVDTFRATHEWGGVRAMGVRNWVLCGIILRSLLVQWKRPILKIRHRKVRKSRKNWGWRNEFRTHTYTYISIQAHTHVRLCMGVSCIHFQGPVIRWDHLTEGQERQRWEEVQEGSLGAAI